MVSFFASEMDSLPPQSSSSSGGGGGIGNGIGIGVDLFFLSSAPYLTYSTYYSMITIPPQERKIIIEYAHPHIQPA